MLILPTLIMLIVVISLPKKLQRDGFLESNNEVHRCVLCVHTDVCTINYRSLRVNLLEVCTMEHIT